ncbi:MAG: ABC transporter permease [Bacteroidales bacterium]|nr:ABC transporter permease [Bacteroidales bacterium]
MNIEDFIAKRFLKESNTKFSQTALRLSILSIALGLMVMILSVSIVTGFQNSIRNKIAAFDGHIRITNYDFNNSLELAPINTDTALENKIKNHSGIKSISAIGMKGGIIKAHNIVQGCVLKGIDENYNWSLFEDWIVKGRTPSLSSTKKSNEILISKNNANKLKLDIDSSILVYFMQDPPRIRKFTICGIYQSGFPDFDNRIIYGDLKHIRKLNKWDNNQISAYEVIIDDFKNMDAQTEWIHKEIKYDLKAQNIKTRYGFIMDWLNLLDTNVFFILGLMVMISGVGMIATLLILILEKTKFIGTMKALGATNKSIRKIFLLHAMHLSIRGLILGNALGIGLALIQKYFHIISLEAETYYMTSIPININIVTILLINFGVIVVIGLMMLGPSRIISNITPIKALRFE